MIEDPRGGAITPDAFLVTVKNPDGSEQTPEIRQNFCCLRDTCDWCNDPNAPICPLDPREVFGMDKNIYLRKDLLALRR